MSFPMQFARGDASPSSSLKFDLAARSDAVCVGRGLDAAAQGLLATIVVSTVIGLIVWFLFAVVRPRFRQVYGLREWFVRQDVRPKPLGSSFFAFLHPHVPLVPPIPFDVSNAGRSPAIDAQLFPSDEQLNQRALWISLLTVVNWTILGLAAALPLYLASNPCLEEDNPTSMNDTSHSTLLDLSLLRLLRLIDSITRTAPTSDSIQAREPLGFGRDTHLARVRVIILTVLTLLLGVIPALMRLLRELRQAGKYRKRWEEIRCDGKELGWLSATKAPGFAGWGEKRLKDFITKTGLSSGMDAAERRQAGRSRHRDRRTRRAEEQPLSHAEDAELEVDIQSLFSVGDTQRLAFLIEERDEILENLEIAETRYIGSFKVSTPDPSIADYDSLPRDPNRPYISRPLPLLPGTRGRRRRRASNPALAASSLAPTSFVAPSQYYKLRGVRGVSGGRFADSGVEVQPSLSESINSRVIGSRFQEVNRNSIAYGRLPLGSHVKVESSGELGPGSPDESFARSRDTWLHGPNFVMDDSFVPEVDEHGAFLQGSSEGITEDWIDLTKNAPIHYETDYNGIPPTQPSSSGQRRPRKEASGSAAHRETFPLRIRGVPDADSLPPPHLRLQPSQPFVRPNDGINYSDLGDVYADITQWRSKLKLINAEIIGVQGDCYNQIAEGLDVKGWLMVGRGLRFIPGIRLIEGRAKEDIRWDVLQNERTLLDSIVLWSIVCILTALLLIGLTAMSGLALVTVPEFVHFLRFLEPLLNADPLGSGISALLAPAVGATVFILLAMVIINGVIHIHGSVSISGSQTLAFKVVFFISTTFAALWLVAVGAVLFGLDAFVAGVDRAASVASGAVYMGGLALAIVVILAIILPAFLVLQPLRLWRVVNAERNAITPRQRFRALYPGVYSPSLIIGPSIIGMVFASMFSLVFPLIGPAVVIFLLLTLLAHRYLVGYVYVRTHSQTGGLVYAWLLKRVGTLIALQPLFLGLIFLSRELWVEGGILVGSGVVIAIVVEVYASVQTSSPKRKNLRATTRESLDGFFSRAKPKRKSTPPEEESTSLFGSSQGTRTRGSMASVLEMMSLTLAVMPSPSASRGPVPLQTETLDDLTATERAARTHPDAPPHLPPLPFTDHAEEMAGILYAPELVAPPPIIWLPNDCAGVARSEAVDLQKYHDLQVTLDVRARSDVMPRRSSSSRHRPSH